MAQPPTVSETDTGRTFWRTRHNPFMPKRTIEVLLVGKQRLPDGRWFEVDRARIARVCAQANAQLQAGVRVPMAWMHDPEAEPVRLSNGTKPKLHPEAWLAKGYFGEPERYFQDRTTGNLWAEVEIHSEKDAEQFDKVGQVSPSLWSQWTDEQNVRWPELTIAHIAATPKPIQRHVTRVKKPAARTFTAQPTRSPNKATAAYMLSFPATPRSSPMADEKEMEMEGTESGSSIDIAEVVSLLKKLDIHGLEDVTEDTLVAALKAAVHTKLGDAGESDEMDMDDMGGDGEEGMEDVAPPVLMSHLVKRVAEFEVRERESKLKAAVKAGKLSKPKFDKFHKQLTAINLSQPAKALFNADGTFKRTELDILIDLLDDMPASPLAGKERVNLSNVVEEVPVPDAKTPEQKEADAAAEVKAHMAKKKAAAAKAKK